MMYQFLRKSKIDYNPCEVEYSRKHNVFVVGTYQLVQDSELSSLYFKEELVAINNRVGSLSVFSVENVCLEQHKCRFGGVFALKISTAAPLQSKSELILAAHANGVVGLYQLLDTKITLHRHFKTNSTMLTTIDDNMENDKWTIWTGASDGRLSCWTLPTNTSVLNEAAQDDEQDRLEKIVSHDPIWFVKVIVCRIGTQKEQQTLAFVGSEDSKWKAFTIRSSNLHMLHQDAAASAGVTSFEVFQHEETSDNVEVTLLCGSYDEHLRIYNLRVKIAESKELYLSECRMVKCIHISGGGVWRLKALHDSVLMSAMYSGAYIVKFTITCNSGDTSHIEYQHDLLKLGIEGESTNSNLIYGIAGNDDLSVIAFASFYTNEVYLVNKIH